jgi:hypothetical protein
LRWPRSVGVKRIVIVHVAWGAMVAPQSVTIEKSPSMTMLEMTTVTLSLRFNAVTVCGPLVLPFAKLTLPKSMRTGERLSTAGSGDAVGEAVGVNVAVAVAEAVEVGVGVAVAVAV